MTVVFVLLFSALGLSVLLNFLMLFFVIRLSKALDVAEEKLSETQYSRVLDHAQELLRGKKKATDV